jgi:hypothetical protein
MSKLDKMIAEQEAAEARARESPDAQTSLTPSSSSSSLADNDNDPLMPQFAENIRQVLLAGDSVDDLNYLVSQHSKLSIKQVKYVSS